MPTLLERLLALLLEQESIPVAQVVHWLPDYDKVAIDPAISLLMRQGKVTLHRGCYSLTEEGRRNPTPREPRPAAAVAIATADPKAPSTASAAVTVPSAQEEAASALDPNPSTKRCKGKCARVLPADREHFYSQPSNADGLGGKCKECLRDEQYARRTTQQSAASPEAASESKEGGPRAEPPAAPDVPIPTRQGESESSPAGSAGQSIRQSLTVQVDPTLERVTARRSHILAQIGALQGELQDLEQLERLYR